MPFLKYFCRNRLLLCILNICKDALGRLPKVVGIDIVEMALWAKVCDDLNLFKFLTVELILNQFYANYRLLEKLAESYNYAVHDIRF